ncbi:MAG: archaellin/type IV pilin N-terminal domain-containing protein [Haloarculaceae archaeon]
MSDRGQSSVVGVALLVGITVVSLGTLTAGVGVVVEEHASRADAARVAADLDAAIAPLETTGRHRGRVAFADGSLRTVERDVRVWNASGGEMEVVERVRVGGLVFESGDRRVASVSGAVLRGQAAGATLRTPPPVTASTGGDDGVLIVGVARLGAEGVAVSGNGGTTTTLRTNVTHERTDLGRGTFAVSLETATPDPLASWFADRGARTRIEDTDGDGVPSVVARFDGERRAYLVVHDVNLEVGG